MADASETKQALGGEGAVTSETPVGAAAVAAAVAAAKGEGEAAASSDKGKGKAKAQEPEEDEDDDDEDSSSDEEEDEDDEGDDEVLDGLDLNDIIAPTSRRSARSKNIDYSSEEAMKKAGLDQGAGASAEDDEEDEFKADEEMEE